MSFREGGGGWRVRPVVRMGQLGAERRAVRHPGWRFQVPVPCSGPAAFWPGGLPAAPAVRGAAV